MTGLALAAYVVGRQTAAAATSTRLAAVERRLGQIENERRIGEVEPSTATAAGRVVDKGYTAFHYETLASQALQEQRMEELDVRLLEVELRRRDIRARRCVDRHHATTGESRHG